MRLRIRESCWPWIWDPEWKNIRDNTPDPQHLLPNSDLENGDDEMVWAEELLYGNEEDVQVGGVLVPPAQGQTV